MPESCVALFTKPARAGRVKTRLIASPSESGGGLTGEQAAELHQAFLDDLSARLASGSFDLKLAWALEEGETLPESSFPGLRQRGEDLGARLANALGELAESYPAVAAVGSDHPELSLAEVERAFEILGPGADVVLGPATDGGYYLIAVRSEALDPAIFGDIAWSTPSVLEATLERCRKLGLTVEFLAEGSDVDTPTDLERLAMSLASGSAPSCPRTEALLGAWGRLPDPRPAPDTHRS